MPELTPRLGIEKPTGNEHANRQSINRNWDIIDEKAETIQGAQEKADSAESSAKQYTDDEVDKITPASIEAAPVSHTHNANDINAGTLADARIPSMNASKINAGTFAVARIPNMNASKINAGTFHADRIPNLNASKINEGTLGTARIPNLTADKITSGSFHVNRIPDLSANKITSGTLPVSRGGTGGTSRHSAKQGIGIFVQSSRPSGASSGDLRAW